MYLLTAQGLDGLAALVRRGALAWRLD